MQNARGGLAKSSFFSLSMQIVKIQGLWKVVVLIRIAFKMYWDFQNNFQAILLLRWSALSLKHNRGIKHDKR